MVLARVVGTVVAEHNEDRVASGTYRIVVPTDTAGTPKGPHLVALDVVGADGGQVVLVAQGSSARQLKDSDDRAIDAVIVGIVDIVETTEGEAGYQAH